MDLSVPQFDWSCKDALISHIGILRCGSLVPCPLPEYVIVDEHSSRAFDIEERAQWIRGWTNGAWTRIRRSHHVGVRVVEALVVLPWLVCDRSGNAIGKRNDKRYSADLGATKGTNGGFQGAPRE